MHSDKLKEQFELITPDVEQKRRMKENILLHDTSTLKKRRSSNWRKIWFITPIISVALALIIIFNLPFGGAAAAYAINLKMGEDGAVFRLSNMQGNTEESGSIVSYVDARPSLEFYIEGDNIAAIEITTETEFIYAVDWTKTQHEKFWNNEYSQQFDETLQQYVYDPSLVLDKQLLMSFTDDFTAYDQIWYRWDAHHMYEWAAEDNFSRFQGVDQQIDFDSLSEQEKMELAAASSSANGHMQLDEYPEHLKEDQITISITDRQGNISKNVIRVKVDNNAIGQTVVTAELVN